MRCTWCGFAFIVALVFLTLSCTVTKANDIYIAQNAGGANTGQSCAKAYPYAFFNEASNWGTGKNQIQPGTTVHLCGVLTAPPGASGYLAFVKSGAIGAPITLRFEPGAMLQAPYWGANGAIYASGLSYLSVEGGSNGVIQATDNGTALGNQEDGIGLLLASCDNCEVKNLTVANIYVHSGIADQNGQNSRGIYMKYGSNATLDNNTVHDAKWCIIYSYRGSSTSANLRMFNNTAYNCDHGLAAGSGNTGAILSGALLYGNTIHDTVNWDDSANNNHHDGIHVWAVHAGSSITGLQVYNNRIYGDWGIHCTANIYIEGLGTIDKYFVFNNDLGAANVAVHKCGNGFIALRANNGGVFNNTIIADSVARSIGIDNSGASGHTIQNNVFYNVGTPIYSPVGTSLELSDYNSFYNMNSTGNAMNSRGKWYRSISVWSAETGFDTHSVTSNPNLSPSPLIGAGADLSGYGISALTFDITSAKRLMRWNIGAFTPPILYAPPIKLRAIAR